jgi:methionyl aminopeptidase
MYEAIRVCKPGVPFSKIAQVVSDIAEEHGLSVDDNFNGHGIGEFMHMPPIVAHVNSMNTSKMEVGNTFTIEPILTQHKAQQIV